MNKEESFQLNTMLVLLLLLFLTACQPVADSSQASTQSANDLWEKWKEQNPCGSLAIERPLYNVSGKMTVAVVHRSKASLHIARNLTLEGALYVAVNCAPIARVNIDQEGRFEFLNLPMGKYVVSIDARDFIHGQGFPIINEIRTEAVVIEQAFQGGDPSYSVAPFKIST